MFHPMRRSGAYPLRTAHRRLPVVEYVFQAVERTATGDLTFVCHESCFRAYDVESAIVTANALFEVIPVADNCNTIEILDEGRALVWTRRIEANEHVYA